MLSFRSVTPMRTCAQTGTSLHTLAGMPRLGYLLIPLCLAFVLFSGCKRVDLNRRVESFKLVEHPEAYIQPDGGPGFNDVLTRMEISRPHKFGKTADDRLGFSWDWTFPLSFDVELPENPRLVFEWGFSNDAKLWREEIRIDINLAQNGIERTVGTIEGKVYELAGDPAWRRYGFELADSDPGKAVLTFRCAGLEPDRAKNGFLLASPRIIRAGRDDYRHVVFIGVDTMRADHLSCYGYGKPTSPNIDKWADDGTRYAYCLSTSPWTFPSFSSMLTGRYPSVCGGTTNIRYLPDDETTIAEIFSRNGFATFSIVNNTWTGKPVNLQQGFDGALRLPNDKADGTFTLARKWLEDNAGEDTFMFLHFMDPHVPYNPPVEFIKKFDASYRGRFAPFFKDVVGLRTGKIQLAPRELEHIIALYDGEIAFFDQQFGEFITFLEEEGLKEDTLIVLTSDHGEEFFEHDRYEHGHSLYDELLRVPLIISGAGIPRGAVDESTRSTMDIFPTLLELYGITIPGNINGRSLIGSSPIGERFLIAEQLLYGEELKGVTSSRYRYIYHAVSGEEELYDLIDDPWMHASVAGERRGSARSMRAFVSKYVDETSSPWHVFFQRCGKANGPMTYTGKITCQGGFARDESLRMTDMDSVKTSGETIEFRITLLPGMEKEIIFLANDESALVSYEITLDGIPLEETGVYIGPDMDPETSPEFGLGINDPRFNLGQPNLRRSIHDGVFIWAVPTHLRKRLQPDLTPEMVEQLNAIGYLN